MEQKKYDVFISYSRRDLYDDHNNVIPQNEVSKILQTLNDAGITYWIDKEGIPYGSHFPAKLEKYINASRMFVFLSTHNSNDNTSIWVPKEIAYAISLQKYIIPVRIDPSPYGEGFGLTFSNSTHVDYYANPEKGRHEIIVSIKKQLLVIKQEEEEARKREQDRKKKEEAEKQKRIVDLKAQLQQIRSENDDLQLQLMTIRRSVQTFENKISANTEKESLLIKQLNLLQNGKTSDTNSRPITPQPAPDDDFSLFLAKWNWGACILSCPWCLANKLNNQAILTFLPLFVGFCLVRLSPFFFIVAIWGWLFFKILLGLKGSRLAWSNSNMTKQEFMIAQLKWRNYSFYILGALAFLIFIVLIV